MNRTIVTTVLATLVLAGLGLTLTHFARGGASSDPPPEPTPPSSSPVPELPPAETPAASLPPAPPASVMVEVQGAVASPGGYRFPANARVYDAMTKAGGALDIAEIRDINIAASLVDGSVLTIPYRTDLAGPTQPGAADLNPPAYTRSGWADKGGEAAGPGPASSPQKNATANGKVNINTATQAELETLPGVGEKTAEKIIRHRETQPFTQVDDLGYVQGIGEKRLETLRPHVTVD